MMKIRCHDYVKASEACVEKTLREARIYTASGTFSYWYLF
jgi:hypothetical protein